MWLLLYFSISDEHYLEHYRQTPASPIFKYLFFLTIDFTWEKKNVWILNLINYWLFSKNFLKLRFYYCYSHKMMSINQSHITYKIAFAPPFLRILIGLRNLISWMRGTVFVFLWQLARLFYSWIPKALPGWNMYCRTWYKRHRKWKGPPLFTAIFTQNVRPLHALMAFFLPYN